MTNIFENYYMTYEAVLKDADIYASPEYLKLLQAVKNYFDSFAWASDETDKKIYLYAGRQLDSSTIADYLNMNANTYRSRVSRISVKLNSRLFNGSELSELCLSGSLELIKKTRIYIESLNNSLVMGKELSSHIFEKLRSVTMNAVEEQSVTEEDMFQALYLITSFSEPVINHKMSQVNPAALKLVMDELFNLTGSEWCLYYKRLQSAVSDLKLLSQRTRNYCKNE